ncbi:hypothetical protein GcC1_002031 [Golovinomyces cichoracearum]|uniref:Uncharacterized protein n=1 Tax=Golovinomyces cichoracearum TaxID=62708 RepID=A0A420J9I5_9PEZI|nr:hypothetical protein GcC1_002031 [Golovinomyces cichoracearum]
MIKTDNIQDLNGLEAQWSFRFCKSTEHSHGGVHASGLADHRRQARGEENGDDWCRTQEGSNSYQQFSDRAENLILTRDLHNEAARFRHEKCNLRTPVEVVMSVFDDNFFWDYKI